MSDRERSLRLIRRARVRLEAARCLKAAARGALAGGGAGVVTLLAMKAHPAWAVVPAVAWGLLAAGGGAGLLFGLVGGKPIGPAAAAFFLDARLGTRERFVTLLTCPKSPFTDRVAAELAGHAALPRIPFPKEAAVVPAALFLLFAAGLLPEAKAASRPPAPVVLAAAGTAAGGAEDEAVVEIDAATLEKLKRGRPPAEKEAERLRESIETLLRRPEERRAARELLEKALRGDAAAAREVARALAPEREEGTGGMISPNAYPGAEEFLREYRRALSLEGGK